MAPTSRLKLEEYRAREEQENLLDVPIKDETEQLLERILFGDEDGFLQSLTAVARTNEAAVPKSSLEVAHALPDGQNDVLMEDVPDEELFFLDSGDRGSAKTISKDEHEANDFGLASDQRQPKWVDSDDERITISLASNTRLRKLRDTEADDVVDGVEYTHRLRRQYLRLYPEPEWIKYARKKQKTSHEYTAASSDSEIEVDNSFATTKPLDEILRSAQPLTRTTARAIKTGHQRRKLRPENIDIQKLKDVCGPGPSAVDTLEFHPYLPLILSGGPSSTVNIYHLSLHQHAFSPLLTSLHVKGTPLHTASFCISSSSTSNLLENNDQTRIMFSSRRRYFHTWSLSSGTVSKVSRPLYGDFRREQRTMEAFKISPCGRYIGLIGSSKKGGGMINILSTETMQWICSCRIDSRGGVADFAWWGNGDGLVVIGKNGEASEYEIESRRVVMRWIDEGAVGTTVISLGGSEGSKEERGGGDRWVAVGSSSGVVTVYDRKGWSIFPEVEDFQPVQRPKPARMFDQLTTPVSHLNFANDGQMLVIGSRWKKNALRLIHLPSCTVYKNWPTDKTPLGRISSVALSATGEYLAVANEQGKIRLWQIQS